MAAMMPDGAPVKPAGTLGVPLLLAALLYFARARRAEAPSEEPLDRVRGVLLDAREASETTANEQIWARWQRRPKVTTSDLLHDATEMGEAASRRFGRFSRRLPRIDGIEVVVTPVPRVFDVEHGGG